MPSFIVRDIDRIATEFIDDFVQQAYRVREEYEDTWEENWSNYRVEPFYGPSGEAERYNPYYTGGRRGGVNVLKTPESHQIVNALRATLLASLYGVRDYVQAIPTGDEDANQALRVSQLIMYGLEQRGNFRTQWDILGDGLIFGTGIYFAGWRTETKVVPRRVPILGPDGQPVADPETGRPMSVLQNVEDTIFDDVTLRSRSLYDVYLDPGADRFEDSNGIVEKFKMRDVELERLRNVETYDAEGIDSVLSTDPAGKKPIGPEGREEPKLLTELLNEDDVSEVSKFGYYGGWRYYGMLDETTAKALDLDPRASATISTINGVVIQAAQNPQRNGEIPFGSLTILPTGRGLYGLSPLTVVRYLQDVSDTQLILTVQAMIESVYQNYVIGGGLGAQANFKRQLETRRPREVFQIEGEVDQLQPLPKDYNGLQIAASALQMISQTMRDAANARDPVQGVINQDRATATQTQITATAALQNIDQLSILIERDELPRQGMLVNDLYYINLDDDGKIFRRIGESESMDVSYFDIDSVSDIKFVGARNALNKQGKANTLRDFMQLLLSTPMGAASVDWNAFVRKYADEALEMKGLESILINDPEEILARLQAMGLASKGPIEQGGGETSNEAGATRPPAQSSGETS